MKKKQVRISLDRSAKMALEAIEAAGIDRNKAIVSEIERRWKKYQRKHTKKISIQVGRKLYAK